MIIIVMIIIVMIIIVMIIIVIIIMIMAVKMIHVCQNMQLVIMQVSMHPEMHDYVDLSLLPPSSSLKDISVNRMKKKDATREAAKKETLLSVTNSLGHHHHAIQVNLKVI